MDDFLDPFLSMTSWADANIHESLPWDDDAAASQLNGIFSDRLEVFERNPPKSDSCVVAPDKIPVPKANEDAQAPSSFLLNPNMRYGVFAQEDRMQHDIQDPIPIQDETQNGGLENRFSFRGVVEHGLAAGSFGTGHDSMASNGSEESLYLQSLADLQSSSTFSQLWATYPSASAMVGQSSLQVLGLHGDLESSLGKGSNNQEQLQVGSYPRSLFENQALQNPHIPSYTSSLGMNIANNIGIQNNQQSSMGDSAKNPPSNVASDPANLGAVNNDSPNIVAKPRARARRGQATDPHSIAERLRREKIAERMKNLQELVPNSNKTDKASMLDEIIEYVKFLQLQVKVLSMSRLGATGAVAPLITEIQSQISSISQVSRNLNLTSAAMDPDLSETQESIAFEQEVVKLMESNVTAAMQFLQNKGLCLMPVALASAISARKGSSSAIPPKKPEGIGPSAGPNARGFAVKDRPEEQQHIPNGCNKAAAKEEETKMSSGGTRNLKSKA